MTPRVQDCASCPVALACAEARWVGGPGICVRGERETPEEARERFVRGELVLTDWPEDFLDNDKEKVK